MKTICIVILNYNNYEDTIECVSSLQMAIDPAKYDIVIVDNNSNNDSVSIIQNKLNGVTLIQSNQNRGYAYGNNLGIQYAKKEGYEYVCVLNNDTIITENFLDICIGYLENHKETVFVSPTLLDYDRSHRVQSTGGDIYVSKGYVNLKNNGKFLNELPPIVESDYIGGACMVFPVKVVETIGYIPEAYFLFFEETEWCYKAKVAGYKNICLTNTYIYHKGSVSIKAVSGLQEYLMERNRVVFVKRNSRTRLGYYRFLIYLLLRTTVRFCMGKEKNLKKYRYYFDGVFNRIDKRFPFICFGSK